jgi:sugar/nucleoside kinase (ribokinase family)
MTPPAAGDANPIAVVAGHICLDIIPTFYTSPGQGGYLVEAGKRTLIGPAQISTGGAVSNTGLALHRLGISTRLIGKIGADTFGEIILSILRRRDPQLAAGMLVDPDLPSSYTIVISAPELDRAFLHCEGANSVFSGDDIKTDRIADATLFHFGYPTSMRRIYEDGGVGLADLLQRAKTTNLATSLDTSHVDDDGPSGAVDWRRYIERIAPYVDFFLPSLEEIFFMLERARFQEVSAGARGVHLAIHGGIAFVRELAASLLQMGIAIVGIKLGDQGFYLRTTDDPARLRSMGKLTLTTAWLDRELLAPAFEVKVAGTTGAGDCAVAGFLSAALRGLTPEEALISAIGAGACNVEVADAIGGIPTWDELQARIKSGWPQRPLSIALDHWHHDPTTGLWHSLTSSGKDCAP